MRLSLDHIVRLWLQSPVWLRVVVAACLAALVAWLLIPGGRSDLPTATAESGEFVIDLKETGSLRAENSITIAAPPVRTNLQIIDMVPEGTVVAKGDFLIQFDSTEIKQGIEDKQADLDIARSNLESSLASMASRLASLESSVENSRASYRLAELRLEQLKFEADVRVEEGRLNLKQAELSLRQAEQQLEAQRVIDSAEVRSLELKIRQAEIDLEKSCSDLEKLRISAPGPGLVVYKETWKGAEMGKVKVGDTPWRGMTLMELPDLSVMMVETSVNEVDVARVKVGQEVEVKLDAYPEPNFHGEVVDVAALAGETEASSKEKVFDVLVRLRESDPLLRPGMSASARIIVDRIPERIWVPIEAVFDRGGRMMVYEAAGAGWKEREVTVGERNDNYVVIKSGLEAGCKVALIDPTLSEEERPVRGSREAEPGGKPTTNQSMPRRAPRGVR